MPAESVLRQLLSQPLQHPHSHACGTHWRLQVDSMLHHLGRRKCLGPSQDLVEGLVEGCCVGVCCQCACNCTMLALDW